MSCRWRLLESKGQENRIAVVEQLRLQEVGAVREPPVQAEAAAGPGPPNAK